MKQRPLAIFALLFASVSYAKAQGTGEMVIVRGAERPSFAAPAEHFRGSARVQPLFDTTSMMRAYGVSVSFDAGARTAWHTHPRGQTLIVTAGVGRVQLWGEPVEEIRAGDVVQIPAGVKHWHGAAPTSAMTHIGIVEDLEGAGTVWFEQVSDEQYRAPVRARVSSRR